MIPFLIRIPKEEYDLYKELAQRHGESLAEYMRKAARIRANKKLKKTKKRYSIFDLGTKIVFKGGPKDGSINADKYYYDFEAKKMRLP